MISEVKNMDCIEYMRQFPDKHFELAIVDPPYGIGFSDYERGSSGIKTKTRYTKQGKKKWDEEIPSNAYFEELMRVSKNQIVWGGNYFPTLWQKGGRDLFFGISTNLSITLLKASWLGLLLISLPMFLILCTTGT